MRVLLLDHLVPVTEALFHAQSGCVARFGVPPIRAQLASHGDCFSARPDERVHPAKAQPTRGDAEQNAATHGHCISPLSTLALSSRLLSSCRWG